MTIQNIAMIGIDYKKADLSTRERFSLSPGEFLQRGKKLKELHLFSGILILNTCNRTELWFSHPQKESIHIWNLFFEKKTSPGFLTARTGEEAVDYLFHLSSGIYSQLFGDDKIHVQINHALDFSRKHQLADAYLESLVRMSVACSKKIKTEVKLQEKDLSLPDKIIRWIGKDQLENKNCLVVGSGMLGTHLASRLEASGSNVWITLRRYKKKTFHSPKGVSGIAYEDRYRKLCHMDYIFSATSSPHKTILKEDITDRKPKALFVDLAVPRDIDKNISSLGLKVVHLDELPFEKNGDRDLPPLAKHIIAEEKLRFSIWNHNKTALVLKKLLENKTNCKRPIPLENYFITKDQSLPSIGRLLLDYKEYLSQEYWKSLTREFAPTILEG